MFRHEKQASKSGYKVIAGIDEVGRGPLAGPVVAAAVILKSSRFNNRIDDSKKLSPNARFLACIEILEKAIVGLGFVNERIIDEINIYNATTLAMKKAVESLSENPDFLLIDGNMKLLGNYETSCIVGGDSKSFSIACASIVAKVIRDSLMVRYHDKYPKYGFLRHKGYGTREHIKKLKKYGPSPIHRTSFGPIKEYKNS